MLALHRVQLRQTGWQAAALLHCWWMQFQKHHQLQQLREGQLQGPGSSARLLPLQVPQQVLLLARQPA